MVVWGGTWLKRGQSWDLVVCVCACAVFTCVLSHTVDTLCCCPHMAARVTEGRQWAGPQARTPSRNLGLMCVSDVAQGLGTAHHLGVPLLCSQHSGSGRHGHRTLVGTGHWWAQDTGRQAPLSKVTDFRQNASTHARGWGGGYRPMDS